MFQDDPGVVLPAYAAHKAELEQIAPAGYTIVMHARYWNGRLMFSTFPKDFMSEYDSRHLIVLDPVVYWAMAHIGAERWSAITAKSLIPVKHVQERAEAAGLHFGAVATYKSKYLRAKKCLISVGRSDRELTDAELARVEELLQILVDSHDSRMGLNDLEIQTLQDLASGYSQDEIAARHAISREAVKKRLERVRKKMGARNATHAVAIAISAHLIEPSTI